MWVPLFSSTFSAFLRALRAVLARAMRRFSPVEVKCRLRLASPKTPVRWTNS
jgi:hypothetical protein